MQSKLLSRAALLVPAILLSSISAHAQTCWNITTQQLGDRLISAIGEKHLVSTSIRKGQTDEFEILIDEDIVTVTPAISEDNRICSIGINTGPRSVGQESLAVVRAILYLTETRLGPQEADYVIGVPDGNNSAAGGSVLQNSELKFTPNSQGGYLILVSAK